MRFISKTVSVASLRVLLRAEEVLILLMLFQSMSWIIFSGGYIGLFYTPVDGFLEIATVAMIIILVISAIKFAAIGAFLTTPVSNIVFALTFPRHILALRAFELVTIFAASLVALWAVTLLLPLGWVVITAGGVRFVAMALAITAVYIFIDRVVRFED